MDELLRGNAQQSAEKQLIWIDWFVTNFLTCKPFAFYISTLVKLSTL